MKLEDIPEMQIIGRDGNPLDFSDPFEIISKPFVQIREIEMGRFYVYSDIRCASHARNYANFLESSLKDFTCEGGGNLFISINSIRFGGFSTSFGKYDIEIVRPIAERYFAQHLPSAKLSFE